jgi:hypothetical protein
VDELYDGEKKTRAARKEKATEKGMESFPR